MEVVFVVQFNLKLKSFPQTLPTAIVRCTVHALIRRTKTRNDNCDVTFGPSRHLDWRRDFHQCLRACGKSLRNFGGGDRIHFAAKSGKQAALCWIRYRIDRTLGVFIATAAFAEF